MYNTYKVLCLIRSHIFKREAYNVVASQSCLHMRNEQSLVVFFFYSFEFRDLCRGGVKKKKK